MTPATDFTGLELVQQVRIEELELRLSKMEAMYDRVAADLIEALDVASAYRAQATEHAFEAEAQRTVADYRQQVNERRNGVERRDYSKRTSVFDHPFRRIETYERRKSWPR